MEHKLVMTTDDWYKLKKQGYFKFSDKGCVIKLEVISATDKEAMGEEDGD